MISVAYVKLNSLIMICEDNYVIVSEIPRNVTMFDSSFKGSCFAVWLETVNFLKCNNHGVSL